MSEIAMSRIPFRVRDEMTILSMARWMRFIGAIKVVAGLLTLFVLLVAFVYVGAVLKRAAAVPPTVKVSVNGETKTVPAEDVRRLVTENQITFYSLAAFAVLAAVVGTALGFVLYQAADDFDRVARTDVADQDYIAAGVAQLVAYFKWSVLFALAAVLVAIATVAALAIRLQGAA